MAEKADRTSSSKRVLEPVERIAEALMQNALRVQRLSNAIASSLLFLTGYAFERCTGYHPGAVGITMVAIGGVLAGLTILPGG